MEKDSARYLGIDLGGTKIAAGVVDAGGRILGRSGCPTPRQPEAMADAMAAVAERAAADAGLTLSQLNSVGVGSPGVIDPAAGEIVYWSNLDFHDVPLASLLQKRLGRPAYVDNDASAAALGEYAAGCGRGCASFLAITLGTGVGGGAVFGGRLYDAFNHAGLEVGHFVIQHNGRLCSCGRRGCFEAYASATALVREANRRLPLARDTALRPGLDARQVFDAAASGDTLAGGLVREFQSYLASGVVSLINLFQPEVLCIGGGLAGAGKAVLDPVLETAAREDYARGCAKRCSVRLAELGNDAGIVGAALLPLYR